MLLPFTTTANLNLVEIILQRLEVVQASKINIGLQALATINAV